MYKGDKYNLSLLTTKQKVIRTDQTAQTRTIVSISHILLIPFTDLDIFFMCYTFCENS